MIYITESQYSPHVQCFTLELKYFAWSFHFPGGLFNHMLQVWPEVKSNKSFTHTEILHIVTPAEFLLFYTIQVITHLICPGQRECGVIFKYHTTKSLYILGTNKAHDTWLRGDSQGKQSTSTIYLIWLEVWHDEGFHNNTPATILHK